MGEQEWTLPVGNWPRENAGGNDVLCKVANKLLPPPPHAYTDLYPLKCSSCVLHNAVFLCCAFCMT